MLDTTPEILTRKECQVILKIGKNSMLNLIHDGSINAFIVGNRWRITKTELIRYINSQS